MRLRDLVRQLGEGSAVWCGAGVSAPSGLPTSNALIRFVLDRLRTPAAEVEILLSARMPFELQVQLLQPVLSMRHFVQIFSSGSPNADHLLLARLAVTRRLRVICTTNFDRLIETALREERMRVGRDFEVYSSPDEFPHVDWAAGQLHLIKLHGTVDRPETIAATLDRVAAREASREQAQLIDHVFASGAHDRVLVLGYSFSDAFDITPQIRAVGTQSKPVLVLHHSSGRRLVTASRTEERLRKELGLGANLSVRAIDTDRLVALAWSEILREPAPKARVVPWRSRSKDLVRRASCARRQQVVGRLFELSGNLMMATSYISSALGQCRADRRMRGVLLTDLGRLCNARGDFGDAIRCGEQALSIAEELGEEPARMRVLGNLAIAHHNIGDHESALRLGREAAGLAHAAEDLRLEGNCHGNLGLTYRALGRYGASARSHERAIRIARRINNLHGEAHQLGNLSVSYRYLHRLDESRQCQEGAIALARLLGDRVSEAVGLGELGTLERLSGRPEAAVQLYRAGYNLAVEVGSRKEVWNELNNLADTFLEMGRLAAAGKYAARAMLAADATQNPQTRATAMITLASVTLAQGKSERALDIAGAALGLLAPLSPRHRLVRDARRILRLAGPSPSDGST